jgi:hypothetical protein
MPVAVLREAESAAEEFVFEDSGMAITSLITV